MAEDLQLARRKWFKTLKPVLPEEMVGLWRGSDDGHGTAAARQERCR